MAVNEKENAMNKKHLISFLLISVLIGLAGHSVYGNQDPKKPMAVMTCVVDFNQKKLVEALIKSLRKFGGGYSQCPVYVVVPAQLELSWNALEKRGAKILTAEVAERILTYPFAFKAIAAGKVEGEIENLFDTLVWMDPGALVLGELGDLDLQKRQSPAVIRTVSLNNNIGLTRKKPMNRYWGRIYRETGLLFDDVPYMKTIVDRQEVKAYLNCQVYSINPQLGLLKKWAGLVEKLIRDHGYQSQACSNFLRKVFLHQAVFSAMVISEIPVDQIHGIPLRSNYPVNHEKQMDPADRIGQLDELRVVVFDERWSRDPDWMAGLRINTSLEKWLSGVYLDFLKMTDNLYRIEGSCVSYLITTREGSVMIDPAGASSSPRWFKGILKQCPLKAVIITHAHRDHWDNMEIWKEEGPVKIIAQRNFIDYLGYTDRLTGFFRRRNAIWARKEVSRGEIPRKKTPIEPNFFFSDRYQFVLGGIHLELTHTSGECPDHTTIWVPELGAVFVGDNYYEYFINNATFRGTTTRPILGYIRAMDLALSYDPLYFLMGHGRPLVGKRTIRETVTRFRDTMIYLHDETIKGMNQGKDVYTLMQEITLLDKFSIKPFYGKVPWTVRGIFHEYAGWFDEDPASMYGLPPSSLYPDLVELAGGVDKIAERAQTYLNRDEYVKALHLTRMALHVDPKNETANRVRLDTLKRLKAATFNHIENIWLDYGIRQCRQDLENGDL